MRLNFYLICTLFFVAMISTTTSYSQSTTSNNLQNLFKKEWAFRTSEFPETGSYAGVESADGKLSKVGIEHITRRQKFWEDCLAELSEIDPKSLSQEDRINYAIFKYQLEDFVAQIQHKAYLIPLNAEGGFYNEILYTFRGMPLKNNQDVANFISRLEQLAPYILGHIELMKTGLKEGYTQPKVIVKNYKALLKPFLTKEAENSIFYKQLITYKNLKETDRKKAIAIISNNIIPTYQVLNTFMEKVYLPGCRSSLGATDLPNGQSFYQQRVNYFSTLPVDMNDIFETGQKEVKRIRAEMESIIQELDFKGSFAEFLTFLRTDPQFYATTPEDLLKEAAWIAKKMDGKLPEYFRTLPRLPYGVQPVPAEIAPNYTTGRYSEGSVKNHTAGNYWVNTYKLESRPLYVLPALTLHEAVPGHHLQISLAQEMEEVPPFRQFSYISSYGEGWALYCEWLGEEAGMYETLYTRFGKLTYEMWRACRLVVDVGLHAKNWTRDQAVEFLASNTALSLHEVNTEIDRYIGWPAQALSYKMGELKIRELRSKAEQVLGDKFDIRDFHDVILKHGAVPLFLLEELVVDWIAAQGE